MIANGPPRIGVRVVLACLLFFALSVAQAVPLRALWRPVTTGETPQQARAAPAAATDHAFDPSRLNAIPAGERGAWIWLAPQDGAWPAGPQVLQIEDPGLQAFSLFPARSASVAAASVMGARDGWQGNGRIGFVLDATTMPSGDAPLLLRIEPGRVTASPTRFALVTPEAFRSADARWLALATACLAIMAAMAVMALLFAIELRDITFVYYAGYVLAYALILAIQTGYVATPLEWGWITRHPNAWGRAAAGLSVLFATLFVARFADLAHCAPRMRIAVLALGVATGVLMALGSMPVSMFVVLAAHLINPLLVLGAPLILAACILAAWRGSRYARFFLLGWTPLLVVTMLGSAQVSGVLATWTWLGDASLVAGAFEALVLSLGLADKALALRHDRDVAQALADSDGLTQLFNRRGLDRRIADLVARAQRQRHPLTVLFLDLDRFKSLNDVHGHAAGDGALVAIARLLRADMGVLDVYGRYGGEEFIAALPGRDVAGAMPIAERIRSDIEALGIPVGVRDDPLTASIGVAALGRGDDAQALIARADRAMYDAKRAGGNRVAADRPAATPIVEGIAVAESA